MPSLIFKIQYQINGFLSQGLCKTIKTVNEQVRHKSDNQPRFIKFYTDEPIEETPIPVAQWKNLVLDVCQIQGRRFESLCERTTLTALAASKRSLSLVCSPASAHIVGIVYSTSLPVPLLINKGNIENDIVIFCGRGGTRTK